mgnify:CR=1 FL=1
MLDPLDEDGNAIIDGNSFTQAPEYVATVTARYGIPVELISMPLAGFVAPVTLVGSLIQQTAENLSGVVISQLTNPGHPILYGGSPAVFDVRYETTPMGAVETMMLDCANSEIGKRLGLNVDEIEPIPFKQQIFNQLAGSKVVTADGAGLAHVFERSPAAAVHADHPFQPRPLRHDAIELRRGVVQLFQL